MNRWTNPQLPQMLQIAIFLLYFRAGFNLLFRGGVLLFFLLAAVQLYGGWGIANERKQGYAAGVAGAVAEVGLIVALLGVNALFLNPLGLIFDIALIALLLHPQSREHQHVWFR